MSRRIVSLIGVAVALAGVAAWVVQARPWESMTDRAYRECAACGIDAPAVNKWIDDFAHSTLSREESVELYLATFEDRDDAEPCRPCVDAVLDAAGR